jgi:hypothetical protein
VALSLLTGITIDQARGEIAALTGEDPDRQTIVLARSVFRALRQHALSVETWLDYNLVRERLQLADLDDAWLVPATHLVEIALPQGGYHLLVLQVFDGTKHLGRLVADNLTGGKLVPVAEYEYRTAPVMAVWRVRRTVETPRESDATVAGSQC